MLDFGSFLLFHPPPPPFFLLSLFLSLSLSPPLSLSLSTSLSLRCFVIVVFRFSFVFLLLFFFVSFFVSFFHTKIRDALYIRVRSTLLRNFFLLFLCFCLCCLSLFSISRDTLEYLCTSVKWHRQLLQASRAEGKTVESFIKGHGNDFCTPG